MTPARIIPWGLTLSACLLLTACDGTKPRTQPTDKTTQTDTTIDTRINTVDTPRQNSRPAGNPSARDVSELRKRHVTTSPEVHVTGSVRLAPGEQSTSVTVELWQDGLSMQGQPVAGTRHATSPVGENGRYQLRGPDGTGLRIEVSGASRPVRDVPSPPDFGTTQPRVRSITQNFVLPALHTVTGTVVDASDQPLPGATVSLRSEDAIEDGWYYDNQKTTTTATGDFRLDNVAQGNIDVGASAPGYPPSAFRVAIPTSGPLVIKLTSGTATAQGRVVRFPAGEAIAGATVSANPQGPAEKLGLADSLKTQSGPSGEFALGNLPAGEVKLTATNPQWKYSVPAPNAEPDGNILALPDNATTTVDVAIFPGYTVTGLVYDNGTSEPLAGAQVRLSDETMTTITTAADGLYRAEGVHPQKGRTVAARYPGFIMAQGYSIGKAMSGPVLYLSYPTDSDILTQDLPMAPVVRISGRVENKEKEPVAGAKVAWKSNSNIAGTGLETVTNPEGLFALETGPFENGIFEVTATGYAFYRSKQSIRINTDDRTDILLTLAEEGRAEGRVINSRGEGVDGATVGLTEHVQIGNSSFTNRRQLGQCDAEGNFKLEGLEASKIVLLANAAGYGEGIKQVDIYSGETRTGIEISLSESFSIEGRVVDSDDKPVAASVAILNSGLPTVSADSEGRFKLNGVSTGKHNITAIGKGNSGMETVEAEAGQKDVKIVFRSTNRITVHGRVIDEATRQPITDFQVEGVNGVQRDGEGLNGFRFYIGVSNDGFWLPAISAPGYAKKTFRVQAPPEQKDITMDFELGVGGVITGRVVRAGDRSPLPSVTVTASEASGYSSRPDSNTFTDADGRFTLSGIAAGKALVTVLPKPPLADLMRAVDVTNGEVTDAGDIEIGGMGRLSGRVQDAHGQPKPDLHVNINAMQKQNVPSSKYARTDTDGRFDVGEVTPGEYRIWVAEQMHATEVAPDEQKDVIIQFGPVTLTAVITRGGVPLPEGRLSLSRGKDGFSASSSSKTGRFRVEGITGGTYYASISEGTTSASPGGGTMTTYKELWKGTVEVPDQPEHTHTIDIPAGATGPSY